MTARILNGIDLESQGINLAQQLPPNARRGVAEVDGFTLGTITIDAREEYCGTAVLVPGYTSSADTFNPLLQQLSERGYTVVAFSQRGQSLSDGPEDPSGYTLHRLGEDIHELISALQIPTPVHLLGHSFGGVVAIEAVLQNPEPFASLTLWNSGPRYMGDASLAAEREVLLSHGTQGLFLAERQARGISADAPLNPIEQYYYDRLFSTKPAQLLAGMEILSTQQDRTTELENLDTPVLVSHGALDDAWPQEMQREMAEQLGADYVVLSQAGHSAHIDRSYASAQVLATFWDEHN